MCARKFLFYFFKMDWSHLPSRAEVANSAFANDDDDNNNNNNSLTTEINGVISERVSARLGKIKMTPAGPEAVEKLEKERIARDLRKIKCYNSRDLKRKTYCLINKN